MAYSGEKAANECVNLADANNKDKLLSMPYANAMHKSDFYLADPISRASVTMAKCVEEVL